MSQALYSLKDRGVFVDDELFDVTSIMCRREGLRWGPVPASLWPWLLFTTKGWLQRPKILFGPCFSHLSRQGAPAEDRHRDKPESHCRSEIYSGLPVCRWDVWWAWLTWHLPHSSVFPLRAVSLIAWFPQIHLSNPDCTPAFQSTVLIAFWPSLSGCPTGFSN